MSGQVIDLHHARAPKKGTSSNARIEGIDLARGVAITMMILSHGIKGLLDFEQIPSWGLVPIHLVTKLSSSLFIVVFGISLAVAFVPHTGTVQWREKRNALLTRGLVVFFWYKVLTIVEMIHLYSRQEILDTLLYRGFPVYSEILGFYAIALAWVPFALPVWNRSPRWLRLLSPAALAGLAVLLSRNFNFWGIEQLQAVLVEHENHYVWGQLARGPLILIGLLIGDLALNANRRAWPRLTVPVVLAGCSLVLLALFLVTAFPALNENLVRIARNEGKHPPELRFMLFSVGGAFLVLAFSFAFKSGGLLGYLLRPFIVIGRAALQSFVFHIVVIFIFYRYLFDYWRSVSYPHALALTTVLIILTALWVKLLRWVREAPRPRM